MKTSEKIGLAAVLVALAGLYGTLVRFIYSADFSKTLELQIKVIYTILSFLLIAVGILYFISFTKEDEGGQQDE